MGRRGRDPGESGPLRLMYRTHARAAFLALVSVALAAVAVGVAVLAGQY
jgi:hypothetical protein